MTTPAQAPTPRCDAKRCRRPASWTWTVATISGVPLYGHPVWLCDVHRNAASKATGRWARANLRVRQ